MLKFLTHKLRTHSLNEENVSEKVGVGSMGRLCAVKVTPPPENGRLARENKGAERSPAPVPCDSLLCS